MKQIIYLLAVGIVCTPVLFSQTERKHAIRLEAYSQVKMPGMAQFNNDDWDFIPKQSSYPYHTDFTRNYFSAAFGVAYERNWKNGLVIRPRIGMTFRKLNETMYVNSHIQHDDGFDDYIVDYSYDYKQQHLNCFLGAAEKITLSRKISLELGVDLAWVHYFKTRSVNYSYGIMYGSGGSEIEYVSDYWIYDETAPVNIYGIGPQLTIHYAIGDRFLVSAGAETFFSYMRINGDNRFTLAYVQDYGTHQNAYEGGLNRHFKVEQFGWTVITPMVSVGYRF